MTQALLSRMRTVERMAVRQGDVVASPGKQGPKLSRRLAATTYFAVTAPPLPGILPHLYGFCCKNPGEHRVRKLGLL